jgi:transposase
MGRYIDGQDRTQSVLFPERLDDWVDEDNPVRVVDVFVDALDLAQLGFERALPAETGRPAYHPGTLLKIYVYGYLNRIQSSRRLEREAQRNVELVWLTGRLMPDFKTIADFRRDNGEAIRRVCREFVLLCRQMQLFADATVAIDGSKFKAVNNRDKNFTDRKLAARIQQIEESIAHYMDELDRTDRLSAEAAEVRVPHLQDKLATVRAQAQRLAAIGSQLEAAPDRQVSLTDPDARSMATSGRGTGIVGYNVQTAVDVQHHLIIEHEVTNLGHDRTQLEMMARRTRDTLEGNSLTVLADRGYFSGEQILACEQAGITALIPKPLTSGSKADGRFDKRDFVYDAERNEYRCPSGQRAIWRMTTVERGMTLHRYWPSACPQCPIKKQCTPADYRRVTRWEHEHVLDVMQTRLDRMPEASRLRRQTVEHPFATLKAWMGASHFLTKTLPKVRTEMSLHVLAYNMKRMIAIFGVQPLLQAMRA